MTTNKTASTEYLLEAMNHLDNSNNDQALTCFEQSVKADPDNYDSWIRLAHLYECQKKIPEAIQATYGALDCSSYTAEPYEKLGYYYCFFDDYKMAIPFYLAAIELNPSRQMNYSTLAMIYLRIGKYSLASDVMQKAGKLNPDKSC